MTADKPRWFPGWGHLRSGALLGAMIMVYGAWVGFVQVPATQGSTRWWVLGIGVVLALVAWLSGAFNSAKAEAEREAERKAAQQRYDELPETILATLFGNPDARAAMKARIEHIEAETPDRLPRAISEAVAATVPMVAESQLYKPVK